MNEQIEKTPLPLEISMLYGGAESLFRGFLRNTTQKRELAKYLAAAITDRAAEFPGDTLEIFDFGSSKGTLISIFSGHLIAEQIGKPVHITCVEPEDSSVKELLHTAEVIEDMSHGKISVTVIQNTWQQIVNPEHSEAQKPKNVAMAVHLSYHIPEEDLDEVLENTVNGLSKKGVFILISRLYDDVFEFNRAFYEKITGKKFNSLTLSNVIPAVDRLVTKDKRLRTRTDTVKAKVTLNLDSNLSEALRIIAFLAGVEVEQISSNIELQQEIFDYFGGKRDVQLEQIDGVYIIARNGEHPDSHNHST